MATTDIACNFVGDFKVGDNIRYNCDVLCKLAEANSDGALNKMILLQVGAILEAGLTQIIYRAQQFNQEGVPNIDGADRQKIEESKIDKLSATIDVLRKYCVLNGIEGDIYEDLHTLRKYRNKIHIQEDVKIGGAARDEDKIFSDELAAWSLALNLRTLRFLSEHLARPPHFQNYLAELTVPV